MNIMNVLRTGMNMYISHIRIMGMLHKDGFVIKWPMKFDFP